MDFVSDALTNDRRFKCLAVADGFTHECVDIVLNMGAYVVRLPDQLVRPVGAGRWFWVMPRGVKQPSRSAPYPHRLH
jgi:hypothetical protein